MFNQYSHYIELNDIRTLESLRKANQMDEAAYFGEMSFSAHNKKSIEKHFQYMHILCGLPPTHNQFTWILSTRKKFDRKAEIVY